MLLEKIIPAEICPDVARLSRFAAAGKATLPLGSLPSDEHDRLA